MPGEMLGVMPVDDEPHWLRYSHAEFPEALRAAFVRAVSSEENVPAVADEARAAIGAGSSGVLWSGKVTTARGMSGDRGFLNYKLTGKRGPLKDLISTVHPGRSHEGQATAIGRVKILKNGAWADPWHPSEVRMHRRYEFDSYTRKPGWNTYLQIKRDIFDDTLRDDIDQLELTLGIIEPDDIRWLGLVRTNEEDRVRWDEMPADLSDRRKIELDVVFSAMHAACSAVGVVAELSVKKKSQHRSAAPFLLVKVVEKRLLRFLLFSQLRAISLTRLVSGIRLTLDLGLEVFVKLSL